MRHGAWRHRVSTGHSAHPWASGWRRHVHHVYQFNVKDQVGLGRNSWMRRVRPLPALCAISQLPRDEQTALAADFHARKALVEAGNQPPHPLRKSHGRRVAVLRLPVVSQHRLAVLVQNRGAGVVVGGVELVPVVLASVAAKPAGIEDLVHLVGLSLCASTDLDVLIAQDKGRLYNASDRWNARRQLHGGRGSGRVGRRRRMRCAGGWSSRFGRGLGNPGNSARRQKENQNRVFHCELKLHEF